MTLESTLNAYEVSSFHRTFTDTLSGTGSRTGIITGIGTGSSILRTRFFLPSLATVVFLSCQYRRPFEVFD